MNIAECPFCNAKPKNGIGKVQYDQLHGEPFQRYRIWCPMGSIVSFEGSHARIEAVDAQTAAGLWNQRPALHAFPSEGFSDEPPAERDLSHDIRLGEQLDDCRAELEQARKDAERYRWLREHSCRHDSAGNDAESWSTHDDPTSLDEVVDAAIASSQGDAP